MLVLVGALSLSAPAAARLQVDEARFEAGDARLRVSGDSDLPPGAVVEISDRFAGTKLGQTTTDPGGAWIFECGGESGPCGSPVVPCVIDASSAGEVTDHRAVEDAPSDCATGPTEVDPLCRIALPAADLRGTEAISPGSIVFFSSEASDPSGRELFFGWDFAGGADARSSAPEPGPIVFDAEGSFRITLTVTTATGGRCTAERRVDVGPLPTGLPGSVPQQPGAGEAGAGDGDHVVLAWNDLGMHCADLGSDPFSILPPFNTLNAQAIRRGSVGSTRPRLLDGSEAELLYSAASNPDDPVGPGSINSTAQNFPVGARVEDAILAKTDFWDARPGGTIASLLFPGLDPLPDEGLQTLANADHGRFMPGIGAPYVENQPQEFSEFEEGKGWFTAQGIPITHIDDAGRRNSYPLMRVQATRPGSGAVVATVDAVVPVSSEVDCRDCHALGAVGADPDARTAGPDFVAPASPSRRDTESAAKLNILRLHDFNHAGVAGNLEGGSPDLCASCHGSAALSSVGGPAGDPAVSSMSRAMHEYHGLLQVDGQGELLRDGTGRPILRELGDAMAMPLIPGDDAPMERNCFLCHPGKITQCFRGAMFTAGAQCADCHGDMLAVGGSFPLLAADGTALGPRRPWLDEPRCESCHTGDAVRRLPGAEVRAVAFDPADPAATPTLTPNPRFAEEPGTLYRESIGHGGLACEACHGSPHAVWPNPDPAANDNVTAVQLQGHAGTLSECSVCHESTIGGQALLGGPHGLHAVADPDWIKGPGDWHGKVYERELERTGVDVCAACHGRNHRGTRLSRTFTDRVLRDAGGRIRAIVPAGAVISCGLCHSLDESFDDDLPDTDGDGVPDPADNCVLEPNPLQADANAGADDDTSRAGVQHYGDVCDADLDDDGLVGPSDFFGVLRPCFGEAVEAGSSCAIADLDGDGFVGPSDFFGRLRPAFGTVPGPGLDEG
ncbi:MAG: PKD domain-containing protein [Myxococcota bacterium]|nr:PKD domain-containing protein [Myxococcota bacterium]